jgi:hypothetical protein
MPCNNAQKTFQTFSTTFDDFVRETIGKDFAGERWDVDSSRFTLEDVAEGFKVGVTSANQGMPQFKGRNVGLKVEWVRVRRLELQ